MINSSNIADRERATKEKAMTSLGWTSEQYDKWRTEWSDEYSKMSTSERLAYDKFLNSMNRQLSVLLWLNDLTKKTRLPFIYLYSILKPIL